MGLAGLGHESAAMEVEQDGIGNRGDGATGTVTERETRENRVMTICHETKACAKSIEELILRLVQTR